MDTSKLKPANENPWYILMTLHGEQEGDEIDWELADKNRKLWNAWVCQGLDEAGGPEHASYDIAEFLGLPIEDAAERALCLQDKRNIGLRDKDPAAFAAALDARIGFEKVFRNPSVTSGGYGRLLQARRGHDCVARLGQIPHATTIIAGRYDMQARPEAQEALAKGLPNAAIALLDSGHGVLFAHPEAARIATAAIKKLSATKETTP